MNKIKIPPLRGNYPRIRTKKKNRINRHIRLENLLVAEDTHDKMKKERTGSEDSMVSTVLPRCPPPVRSWACHQGRVHGNVSKAWIGRGWLRNRYESCSNTFCSVSGIELADWRSRSGTDSPPTVSPLGRPEWEWPNVSYPGDE